MKKIMVSILFVGFFGISCSEKLTRSSGGDAAIVNGIAISHQELDEAAKTQLQRVETQIYQIKNDVLENLIEQKLIEAAAKKENMSAEDYLKREVEAKIKEPTEEELKKLYESRPATMKESFEQLKDQITQYVKNNQQAQEHRKLIANLRNGADIKIMIEPPRSKIDMSDSPFSGPKDAKVTLIEFSDYECPFCKRVFPTVQRIRKEYADRIKYVFKDFPLSFHSHAQKAHEAAYCAGDQNKYFEYNEKLFENQQGLEVKNLKKYAGELQLNTEAFTACLDSGKYALRVQQNAKQGAEAGVSGTPAFFINGILLSGAQPYEQFKQIIESELKR